jgi:protein SCO1/2
MKRQDGRLSGRTGAAVLLLMIAAFVWTGPVRAQQSGPSVPGKAAGEPIPVLKEIGIDQKLDAQVPLDLEFSDERGNPVKLGQYFGSRPVVLALVYYSCPMLCTQVLNGLAGSLQGLSLAADEEYEIVVVSFDPGETPAMAVEKKQQFASRYIRQAPDERLHFLTGRQESIAALTGAVGFRYVWDQATGQFAHPAAITVLTSAGRISRYLYGVEFAPRDLKLALVEASEGQIGSVVDQALLFCYHYDPESGRYGFVIMNIVRAAGALTVLLLVGSITWSVRREKRRAGAAAHTATTGTR